MERKDVIASPETIPCGRHWYAVHTRSRHEKMVGSLLAQRGIDRFLPLVRTLSQWADRRKWVERPLFPGYLFVRIHHEETPTVRETGGVVRLLGTEPFRPSIVPDAEVENIRRLLAARVSVDPYPYLKPGQLVYITRGALRGVEGTLIRKSRRYFLVISVKLFGRSVVAEVSAEAARGL